MSKPTDAPESTKLLPCPFCGKPAAEDHLTLGCLIFCINEQCPVRPETGYGTREVIVSEWNQRTPAASPVAPPESPERK